MPLYQTVFNGCRVVHRPVKKQKKETIQAGGAIAYEQPVQLKAVPKAKEEDKMAVRKKVAALLFQTL